MNTERRNACTRLRLALGVLFSLFAALSAQGEPTTGPMSQGKWLVAISVLGGGGQDETKIAADDDECAFRDDRLCSGEDFKYGLVQLDLRVFTPRQIDIPGDPRFFVRGGLAGKFGKDVAVKVEPVSEDVYIQSAKAKQDGLIWDAGFGVAFPFSYREQPLQFEVSVSYGQEKIKASGRYADDDAGKFRLRDELDLPYIKEVFELTGPVSTLGSVQLEGVVGAYLQHTLSNKKSRQRRSRVVDYRYEKSLGYGGFVGVRVSLGQE